MGDFFERIVDVEVTDADAGPLAERIVDWMVEDGLITREVSGDGVYSPSTDTGYLPGPNWRRSVADSPDPDPTWLPGPVAVMVGRDYYVGGQGVDEADAATCPRCTARTVIIDYPEEFEPDDEAWQPFAVGIAAWKETGEGNAVCPSCAAQVPVTEWDFGSGFTLGTLAFDFWDWPPLSAGFLAEFAGRLGHRTAEQTGKF
ncbi:hypothetical protein CLM62_34495 [Streptomyces sp. SA15]|uniref:hypothetical protein n=1 Tax=Streptomyces sp. SA15 TaxID=934019 RepID=UPI000BAFD499|nr:hypothetical protein [Streptomyces sp. SA15]PAZ11712.1 hypothetical protein CLM62_34495 [Streptomyces sp. SA15]